jgi:uncharacterized protein
MKSLKVKCPICKTQFTYHDGAFRPFCSERCRNVDLGKWLTESYAVPAQKMTDNEAEVLDQLMNENLNEESSEEENEDWN